MSFNFTMVTAEHTCVNHIIHFLPMVTSNVVATTTV